MPVVEKTVAKYTLTHFCQDPNNREASISLWDANLKMVGVAEFWKDSAVRPACLIDANSVIKLYYPISSLSDIANTLRYEKPIRLWINTDTKFGSIGTLQIESAGEQEGV